MAITESHLKHRVLTEELLRLAQTLDAGDRFPSQTELMRRYCVSDRTVLRSLEELQRAGWIVRKRGSGTFVTDPLERRAVVEAVVTATGRSTVAALALSLAEHSFYKSCVDELTRQSQPAGLAVVCQLANEASFADALLLEALEPCAFVLFSYRLVPIAKRLLERGHRVVIVGAPPAGTDPAVPTVYGDHGQGGYDATRHLLDLGHRRIAFCFTTPCYPIYDTLRWQGHNRALSEARREDAAVRPTVVDAEMMAAWREEPEKAADFFSRPEAPTGIVCWNDSDAIGLIGLLHIAGVRVPDDVSIVGFDAIPESEVSVPPLTTVDQHVPRQMRTVIELFSRPSPPPATQSVVVVPQLVPRASCGPPRT